MYGSGKTTSGAVEVLTHVFSTPNGATLVGAKTVPQLDQTAKKELLLMLPETFIEVYHKQKDTIVCKNGHVILFRPLDDEGKIRSLNLTMAWIEEASEVDYDIFVQLQTRIRNPATKHHQIVLTTNPDLGWIKDKVLLIADKVYNATFPIVQDSDNLNSDISVHIAPTHLNKYLPNDYEHTIAKGKPEWWIRRYLYGSFEHSEGLVYPMYSDFIVDPFPIPKYWERMFGADFGLRDPTVMLAAAIDPKDGVIHIYDEHYESQKSIGYHAQKMLNMFKDAGYGLIRFIKGDPSGRKKSEKDLKSTFDNYAEHGVYFSAGNNRIQDGIMKVFSYFEMGKIRVHSNCVNTVREFGSYKYPEQSLDQKRNNSEIPIDKDNHAMDCLRYIVAELPDNPDDLMNGDYSMITDYRQKQAHLPHALRDISDDNYSTEDWYQYY